MFHLLQPHTYTQTFAHTHKRTTHTHTHYYTNATAPLLTPGSNIKWIYTTMCGSRLPHDRRGLEASKSLSFQEPMHRRHCRNHKITRTIGPGLNWKCIAMCIANVILMTSLDHGKCQLPTSTSTMQIPHFKRDRHHSHICIFLNVGICCSQNPNNYFWSKSLLLLCSGLCELCCDDNAFIFIAGGLLRANPSVTIWVCRISAGLEQTHTRFAYEKKTEKRQVCLHLSRSI